MHTVRNRSYATADRESPSSRISTLVFLQDKSKSRQFWSIFPGTGSKKPWPRL